MTPRELSPADILRLEQALDTLYRPVLLLAVTTGFRVSELRTLRFIQLKKSARVAKEITVPRRSMKGGRVPHANHMADVAKASQLRKHGSGDAFPLNFYTTFFIPL